MSLADSILIAAADLKGATILTCDHHEFDIVDEKEDLEFLWIR